MHKTKLLKTITPLALTGVALFLGNATAAAPTLSKAYNSTGPIADGSIVRLLTGTKNTVGVANSAYPKGLIGVKEQNSGSLLAINPSNSTVQVAVSGSAETLVSTINGNIKQGDYVAVSPFGGMGMESSPGDYVVGVALQDFNSKSLGAKKQTVTDKAGNSKSVWAGEILVSIAIGTDNTSSSEGKLNSLQKIAYSLTGHTISTVRVVSALVLAVLAFATLITLTYAATYGSIISLGRNPLAKYEIFKGLRSIVLALFGIALVAGLLIYLLLS